MAIFGWFIILAGTLVLTLWIIGVALAQIAMGGKILPKSLQDYIIIIVFIAILGSCWYFTLGCSPFEVTLK